MGKIKIKKYECEGYDNYYDMNKEYRYRFGIEFADAFENLSHKKKLKVIKWALKEEKKRGKIKNEI